MLVSCIPLTFWCVNNINWASCVMPCGVFCHLLLLCLFQSRVSLTAEYLQLLPEGSDSAAPQLLSGIICFIAIVQGGGRCGCFALHPLVISVRTVHYYFNKLPSCTFISYYTSANELSAYWYVYKMYICDCLQYSCLFVRLSRNRGPMDRWWSKAS